MIKKRKRKPRKEEDKRKSASNIKRELTIIERELNRLVGLQWKYAKGMLKFGLFSWILGIAMFLWTLIIYQGPELIPQTPPISISLLIFAAAVPVLITVVTIRKFSRRIRRLERIRRGVLSEYERTLLREAQERITG